MRRIAIILSIFVGSLASLPATAQAVTKAMWGPWLVHGVSQFPIYRDLGVKTFEIQLHWDSTAPTRPAAPTDPSDQAYAWPSDIAGAISQARLYHIAVLIQITGAPRWANGGNAPNHAPPTPGDFGAFAAAAAREYPGVHLWMIWGEPSRRANFIPQDPGRYARLLDASYGALKSASRANVVIGGNTFTGGDTTAAVWVLGMRLPNGRSPRLDMYGHNPFAFRTPNLANPPSPRGAVDFSDLARFTPFLDRHLRDPHHRRLKIFVSEWTVPTDRPDSEFNFFVNRPTQVRFIRGAFSVARRFRRIDTIGWIHLRDDLSGGPPVTSTGGLLDGAGHPKPGYFAFRAGR